MKIVKRDGHIVDYDPEKNRIAIGKANNEGKLKEKVSEEQIEEIIKYIEDLNKKTRLYFKGKDLKYIKTISGENEEILKVEISDKVDNNLFQLPEGYEGN